MVGCGSKHASANAKADGLYSYNQQAFTRFDVMQRVSEFLIYRSVFHVFRAVQLSMVLRNTEFLHSQTQQRYQHNGFKIPVGGVAASKTSVLALRFARGYCIIVLKAIPFTRSQEDTGFNGKPMHVQFL